MPRGRPPNIIKGIPITTHIPEDVMAKMELHLFSELEGRVPKGAYGRFLSDRIREYFSPRKSTCPHCQKEIV